MPPFLLMSIHVDHNAGPRRFSRSARRSSPLLKRSRFKQLHPSLPLLPSKAKLQGNNDNSIIAY